MAMPLKATTEAAHRIPVPDKVLAASAPFRTVLALGAGLTSSAWRAWAASGRNGLVPSAVAGPMIRPLFNQLLMRVSEPTAARSIATDCFRLVGRCSLILLLI